MDGQLALRLNTYLSGVEAGLFPASHGPDNNYQPKITNLALDIEYGGRRSFVSPNEDIVKYYLWMLRIEESRWEERSCGSQCLWSNIISNSIPVNVTPFQIALLKM